MIPQVRGRESRDAPVAPLHEKPSSRAGHAADDVLRARRPRRHWVVEVECGCGLPPTHSQAAPRRSMRGVLLPLLLLLSGSGASGAAPARSEPGASGFDQAVTLFSPSGRLHQVEYAMVAVEKYGAPLVAVQGKSCAVLASRRLAAPHAASKKGSSPTLVKPAAAAAEGGAFSSHSIFRVRPGLWMGCTGVPGDVGCVVRKAREIAVEYEYMFGHSIPRAVLARELADEAQKSTQQTSTRPMGVVSVIVGSDSDDADQHHAVDGSAEGPSHQIAMSQVDASGQLLDVWGAAIGGKTGRAIGLLEKHIDGGKSLPESWNDCAKIALEGLRCTEAEGQPLTAEELEIFVCQLGGSRYCSAAEVEALLRGEALDCISEKLTSSSVAPT
jgi:20S proteasome alpha/beta subunit